MGDNFIQLFELDLRRALQFEELLQPVEFLAALRSLLPGVEAQSFQTGVRKAVILAGHSHFF